MKNRILILLIPLVVLMLIGGLFLLSQNQISTPQEPFTADRAFQDVLEQTNLGPRIPGSDSHKKVVEYITTELENSGWKVEIQQTEKMGHPIQNIIARRGNGKEWIILGAHYDSRLIADQDEDPQNAILPVPGANDGASGVAVLLELARVLPQNLDKEVWLVFFDAEDQGKIPGWEWILGSRAFVEYLNGKPDAVVVVDMIGDADLNIYREKESDTEITDEIWQSAAELGFSDYFINEEKYSIIDDHLPFLEAGISAIDIIDIDYPYWHTSEDTPDKVSPRSLEIIGMTLLHWLGK